MPSKKNCVIALVAVMVMMSPMGGSSPVAADPISQGSSESSAGLHTGWMEEISDYDVTYNRTYEYYIPSSYDGSEAVPLLFSFHGLGSNGDDQRDLTRFDELAEQEEFIAVFPNATVLDPEDYPEAQLPPLPGAEIQWNLGGDSLQYYAGIDDVGFAADMVNWFETNYNIDASRIYSTGMSDGGLFSYLLAFNLTGTFAAIAPVCAPMPWGFGNLTTAPITVIEMHGTADPIISYYGYGGSGGNVTYSVDETIAYWCWVDNITSEPVETVWGPSSLDNTVVHRYVYSGGTDGTEVILFKVDGGGHTWPGGPQYYPEFAIGKVTHHINGSALIWKHLPGLKYYLGTHSTESCSATADGHNALFFEPGDTPTEISLVATPGSCFKFVNWTWTGNISAIGSATSPTTTITITPDQDYEIYASFVAQYDLAIDSTDGGETIPSKGTCTYDAGTVVDLVATPASGYEFVRWTGGGIAIGDANAPTTTITMNGDYSITATFQEEPEEPSGGMCFIATAAYGTSTATQLDVLREFRDDVLLESTVGSRLVDLYYQASPPIADFISEHSFVKTLARELMIDPIVWVVETTGDMWRN
jgi:polyhydroxybutyrate depolymerase